MVNLLLQVSVRELHNSMVSPLEEGGLKEASDKDNNIIISDSVERDDKIGRASFLGRAR